MRRLIVPSLLISAALIAQPQQAPPDRPLNATEVAQIVGAVAGRIDDLYVDPVKGKEIASALRAAMKSGRFDDVHSALALVPLVNRVLRTSGDPHLRFGYSDQPSTKEDDAQRRLDRGP